MNRQPFMSLQNTHLQTTLKFARIFSTLGILGFYITLGIAGFTYLLSSDNTLLSFSINQIISQGVITSLFLLACGCMLAVIISVHQKATLSASLLKATNNT